VKLNLKNKKMLIAGIQGSGKTYLAKWISRNFKTAVYTPHINEWNEESVVIYKSLDFVREAHIFFQLLKNWAKTGKIELGIIDEADMIFRGHFDVLPKIMRDVVINHRHYNLALIFITRRPQDLPTRLWSICENLALFQIESPQAIRLYNNIYMDMGEMVRELSEHYFILKQMGEKPVRVRI